MCLFTLLSCCIGPPFVYCVQLADLARRPLSTLESDDFRQVAPLVTPNRSNPDELSSRNLRLRCYRQGTFHDWPKATTVSVDSLAKAGFYYTGLGDMVRCTFCKTRIYNWKPGDVPTEEHRRLVPSCLFVQLSFCFLSQQLSFPPLDISPRPQRQPNSQV